MRARILVLAVLVATSLAGCLEAEVEVPEPESSTEETQSLDANVTNLAPVASLLADLSNGTAPLNVTFTLDASDADGDNLTWTFDSGANGTHNGSVLPAVVNATYLAGNWTATFTVTDGTNETVETLDIIVLAGNVTGAAENATAGPVEVFTGSAAAGSTPTAQDTDSVSPCVGYLLLENGLDCYYFEIPADYAGHAFDTHSSAGTADASFWSGCDPLFNDHTGTGFDDAGTIPEGTQCVVLFYFGLAPDGVDFTFNVY